MIYFDNASTTSVRTEVCRVYEQMLTSQFANSDSLHAPGREVNRLMEASRAHIANLLNVRTEEVIFTGSASEANSLALIGYCLANQNRGKHVLISNVEHPSIDHCATWLMDLGFEVERLPINNQGIVTEDVLEKRMRKDTILVSCMHVNNEMGAINPIENLAAVVHAHPTACFHSDCVQSFSKIDVSFPVLDMATLSMHKIHGLKGSGILIKKRNVKLKPLIQGGQQEQGLRGGTSNAPVNIAAAKTIRLALEEQKEMYPKIEKINCYLRNEILNLPGGHINSPDEALPYILNIAFDAITSEVLLNALDAKGICVSAKSTCSSHSVNLSDTLKKMGHSDFIASHMVRLSFDGNNTMEEAKAFIQACKEILENYGLQI